MIQKLFSQIGIYWAKHRYMPYGIDWLLDIKRFPGHTATPTVIDVGANVGQTTARVLEVFPSANVHGFEPVRETFVQYKRRFEGNLLVNCNHAAVSDFCGIGTVQAEKDSQHSHLVKIEDGSSPILSSIQNVDIITMDGYLESRSVSHIDILKTDTEGNELPVLKGSETLLQAGQIDWVLAETTFNPSDQAHSQFNNINDFLVKFDMSVYCFYDHGFTSDQNRHLFCNVLFKRNGFTAER
jgi:FkbM family methyltransferase